MTLPVMTCLDAKAILTSFYETTYGIYNHAHPDRNRVMGASGMHEIEDTTDGSLLEDVMDRYIAAGIKDVFMISLDEFMAKPRDVCMAMAARADRISAKKNGMVSNIVNEIEQEFKV